MKIRPNGLYYASMILLGVCALICVAAFAWGLVPTGWIAAAVMGVLFLWIALRVTLANGKTLTLQSDGCTISVLGLKKHYLWSDFSVIRMEDCADTYSYRQNPGAGILFSVKPAKRPKRTGPTEYILFRQPFSLMYPFSTFFLSFSEGYSQYPNPYFADRDTLLAALHQWGVAIEK